MQAATSSSRNVAFGTSWVGQSVDGRFPLQKYLGGSNTTAVFLTNIVDTPEAKAVIKLVLANSCDPEVQLGLWRRAAKLSHPNLIRILDGGRCWLVGSDLIFVVMEYAEENLGEVLPRRALTPAEGEVMLRPIIEALKYLHRQGLVHGHLRPSNVMAANEQLKISAHGIRPVGAIHGPVEASIYDAPEMRTGKISVAADAWSLGAVLAEALTRKGATQNGASRSLPKPFAAIVQHCLRDDPGARWTLTDIEAALQGRVVDRRGGSEVRSSDIRPQVRRFLPLALGAVLLLILAGIYGLVYGGGGGSPKTASVQPRSSVPAKPSTSPVQKSPVQTASSESASGAVLHAVSPNASQSALRTIHGRIKVRVRVGVDGAGNVNTANLTTAGPSKYFSRLAMQAAQQWKFTPAKENGQPVPSQWTILFEYTRSGISQQANPSAR
jgi:TonB family protein